MNIKKFLAGSLAAVMAGSTLALGGLAAVDLGDFNGDHTSKFVTETWTGVVGATSLGSDSIGLSNIHLAVGDLRVEAALNTTAGTGTSTGSTTEGEVFALFSSNSPIFLNRSINARTSAVTDTNLPTVLADYTFDGDVSRKVTSTVKILGGAAAGGDNSNKIIFSKQPKSSNDPVFGLSLGTSQTSNPFYNASVTFGAINFTHADSEGEEIKLFGSTFTISADTDTTNLVLLKEAEKASLTTEEPTATVTIGGREYTVELVSSSDTTATIKITNDAGVSEQKEITEADSKKVNGVTVAVVTADETNFKLSASVIVGADKLTFANGAAVTKGDNADPIDGTFTYIVGGTGAATEFAVTVYRPDSSSDAILEGQEFVDPVFGGFKMIFAGLNYPQDSESRETISIDNSGDTAMQLTMTDSDGKTKSFDFVFNATYASAQANTPVYKPANLRLADDGNNSIFVHEGANLTEDDYVVIGNEDYGHLLEVIQLYNNTGTDFSTDVAKFQDVISNETFSATFTSENAGTIDIDGKSYAVRLEGSGDTGIVTLKYPAADSATVNTWVVYPTIQTKSGANVALYEPLEVSLAALNGTIATSATVLSFPDGDGYTTVTATYQSGNSTLAIWQVGSTNIGTGAVLANGTTATVGRLTYNITGVEPAAVNRSKIFLNNPESAGVGLASPAVVVFEAKDDNNNYEAVIVDIEPTPAGTSTDGVGVNSVRVSTAQYNVSATLQSDSDITKDVDWWGTVVTTDANDADQKDAKISYPKSQVQANLYIAAKGATVSAQAGVSGGNKLDTQIADLKAQNLVLVGGPAVNTLVAEAAAEDCGTDGTGVWALEPFRAKGEGNAQIQLVNWENGNWALVVAGNSADDTLAAVTKLSGPLAAGTSEQDGTDVVVGQTDCPAATV